MKPNGKLPHVLTVITMSAIFGVASIPVSSIPLDQPEPVRFNRCWQRSFADRAVEQLAADDVAAYVSLEHAAIKAVDLDNGVDNWFAELGGSVISNLLVIGNAIYVASGPAAVSENAGRVFVRSVSKLTGITNWSVPFASSERVWLLNSGGNVIAVGESGSIASFSSGTGVISWQTTVAGQITAEPALSNGKILIGTAKKLLNVFSAADGRLLSAIPVNATPSALSFVFDDEILVGDERGNLWLFGSESSPAWHHKNGARIASVSRTRRGALVSSFDNFIYMLSQKGDVVWKRRLQARPNSAPAILDSVALVGTVGNDPAYILDLKNGKILSQVGLPGDTTSIAALSGEGDIVFLSSSGLSLYSLSACSDNQKRRP